eukprot:TCONS_00023374-protein
MACFYRFFSRKRTLDDLSKDTNKKPVQNDEKSSSSKSSTSDVSPKLKKCPETTTKTPKKDSKPDSKFKKSFFFLVKFLILAETGFEVCLNKFIEYNIKKMGTFYGYL